MDQKYKKSLHIYSCCKERAYFFDPPVENQGKL